MPDHILYRSPLGKITNRNISLACFVLLIVSLWNEACQTVESFFEGFTSVSIPLGVINVQSCFQLINALFQLKNITMKAKNLHKINGRKSFNFWVLRTVKFNFKINKYWELRLDTCKSPPPPKDRLPETYIFSNNLGGKTLVLFLLTRGPVNVQSFLIVIVPKTKGQLKCSIVSHLDKEWPSF